MENNYMKTEEYKTFQNNKTEVDYKNNIYTLQNSLYKNKIDYSKRLQTKNMATINKFFSRDRMILEVPDRIKNNTIFKLKQKKNTQLETVEKEKLINQLILTKKETDKMNIDLKDYRDFYHQLQESNLTFKVIIERILKINDSENIEDNINENKKIHDKKKEKKINAFKRQIIDYEKSIEKQEKILEVTKKGKKTNDFYEKNRLLKEVNHDLENLITKNNKLQISKHKKEEEINCYFNLINDLRVDYNKMQDLIKLNEKHQNKYKNDILNLIKEKYQIVKKSSSLVEESINLELDNEQKKDESEKVSGEYEKIKENIKEKEKDETETNNITNKIDNIKKVIQKNINKISILNYDIDEMENDINIILAEYDKLIAKYKIEQKYKSNEKQHQKDKKLITEEVSKNRINSSEIKNENKENLFLTIPENTRQSNDNNLMQKIEELQKELEAKRKESKLKEKELEEIKAEYEALKNIRIK